MSEAVFPGNESREHFLLKQIALIWLKARGSQYVGTEIDGMGGATDADYSARYIPQRDLSGRADPIRLASRRSIADVVGVRRKFGSWCRETKASTYEYEVRLVEAKATRADFLSGYCTGAHLAYVITPPGLVKPDELESGVGLLEADVDKLPGLKDPKHIARLVRVAKRPRRSDYCRDPVQIVEDIAARYTNDAVYKNPWIKGLTA